MNFNRNLEAQASPQHKCKGRFYRFLESTFIGKGGRLVSTKELRPLKSLSCPGCEICWPDEGCIQELIADMPLGSIVFDSALEPNGIAQLVLVVESRDPEMDYIEDYHYLARPAPPPTEPVSSTPKDNQRRQA